MDMCPPTLFCQNLTSQHAKPVMTEVCRDEPITVCEVEEVVQPVVRRKFTYQEFCMMIPSVKCKVVEKMKLEPRCSTKDRPVCDHHMGEESCEEKEMMYCHQDEEVKQVEVCDDLFETTEL